MSNPEPEPIALKPKEQKFADLWLAGMPAGRAYEAAGHETEGDSANVCASRMLRRAKVAAYIKAERQRAYELSKMEKWEALKFLEDVIRTPVGEIDEMSPLTQEFTRDSISETTVRRKIKIVSKFQAIQQLSRMMGWDAPQKHEVDVSDRMADLIQAVRKGNKADG